jgi:hypothetical protein
MSDLSDITGLTEEAVTQALRLLIALARAMEQQGYASAGECKVELTGGEVWKITIKREPESQLSQAKTDVQYH